MPQSGAPAREGRRPGDEKLGNWYCVPDLKKPAEEETLGILPQDLRAVRVSSSFAPPLKADQAPWNDSRNRAPSVEKLMVVFETAFKMGPGGAGVKSRGGRGASFRTSDPSFPIQGPSKTARPAEARADYLFGRPRYMSRESRASWRYSSRSRTGSPVGSTTGCLCLSAPLFPLPTSGDSGQEGHFPAGAATVLSTGPASLAGLSIASLSPEAEPTTPSASSCLLASSTSGSPASAFFQNLRKFR